MKRKYIYLNCHSEQSEESIVKTDSSPLKCSRVQNDAKYYKTKLSKAFTFAEVMITLVIIGVVSMLVVPALLDSSNQKLNAAAAKKAKMEIAQASLLVQSDTGCIRWRCSNNDIHTKFHERLKNTGEIKYKIQVQTNNATSLHILANVDGDTQTDIEYIVNNDGTISDVANCTVEDYVNNTAARSCPAWPTGNTYIDGGS